MKLLPVQLGRFFAGALMLAVFVQPLRLSAQMVELDALEVPVGVSVRYSSEESYPEIHLVMDSVNRIDAADMGAGPGDGAHEVPKAIFRMKPGKDYVWSVSAPYTDYEARIDAPPGYTVYVDDQRLPSAAGSMPKVRIERDEMTPVGQASSLRPGRIVWTVGMGQLSNGRPAGQISLIATDLGPNTFKPAALSYDNASPEVERIFVNGALRQIYAAVCLVDITTDSAHAFRLKFYPRTQVGGKSGGIYGVSGTPLFEYLIENPDTPSFSYNKLRITRSVKQAADSHALVMWTEMQRIATGGTPAHYYKVVDWVEKTAGATMVSGPVVKTTTYSSDGKTESIAFSNGTTTVAGQSRSYSEYSWGKELASINGGRTAANAFTYNDGEVTAQDFDGSGSASYEYYTDFDRRGEVKTATRPFDAHFEVTTFDYSSYYSNGKFLPKSITSTVSDVVASKAEISYSGQQSVDSSRSYAYGYNATMLLLVATRKDYYDATHYVTTITKRFSEYTDPEHRFFNGLTHFV